MSFWSSVRKLFTGQMPLHQEAGRGNAAAVGQLVKQGADVNARDYGGRTPLHLSVEGGHLDVVKVLLDGGADVHARMNQEVPPDPGNRLLERHNEDDVDR